MRDQPGNPLDAIGPLDPIDVDGVQEIKALPRRRSGVAGRLTVVSIIVLLSSTALYPFLPRTYTATADVVLHLTNQDGRTTWNQSVREAIDDNAIQTKMDMLRSDSLQREVINQNHLMDDPEFNSALRPSWLRNEAAKIPWLADWFPATPNDTALVERQLLKHLTVRRDKKSYMIQVGYASLDPIKSARLTNSLVKQFTASQLSRKLDSHRGLLRSLATLAGSLEASYKNAEQVEHDFIVSSGLIHKGENESVDRQLASLSTSVAEAHRRTVEAVARADMLSNAQRSGGLDNTADVLASPLLQKLRQRFDELSSGAGSGSAPSGVNQTILTELRRAINGETQHLVQAAVNEANTALAAENALRSEIARLDLRLMRYQTAERTRIDLHRSVVTAQDALTGANQRLAEEISRGASVQPDAELVSVATVPDRPSFPNPLLYAGGTVALMVLLCGLLLSPTLIRNAARD